LKVLNDTETLSDVVLNYARKIFDDTVAMTDSVTTSFITITSLSDEFSLSDYLEKLQNRGILETATFSDALTKLSSRAHAEAATLADSVSFLLTRTFTEAVAIADDVIAVPVRMFEEALSLADTLTIIYVKSFTEDISLGDSNPKLVYRTLSEISTLTDTVSFSAVIASITLIDTLTLAGSALFATQTARGEEVGLTDACDTRLIRKAWVPFIRAVDILPVVTVVDVAPDADIHAIQDRPQIRGVYGNIQL
jgi:hypothetical protein